MEVLGVTRRVPLEVRVAEDGYLSHFADGQLVEVVVEDPYLGTGCGPAGSVCRSAQVRRCRRTDQARLGGVVAVVDHIAEPVHETDDGVGPHSRSADRGETQ